MGSHRGDRREGEGTTRRCSACSNRPSPCKAFPAAPPRAMARATTSHGEPQLTLAESWLVAIGRGSLRVADATEWASARVAEGGADGMMEALARCFGSSAERQLHSWVQRQPWRGVMPQPYSFQAPLLDSPGGKQKQGDAYCILPHELFASLGAAAPKVFEELFGSSSEREAFWRELVRTAREAANTARGKEHKRWCKHHPCASAPAHLRVPLGLHGDAVEMHGGEKVLVVSWGGLCRHGPTLDTRLLFVCLKDSLMVHAEHATLFKAFEVLAWSFGSLARGVHPACDHEGEPFTPQGDPRRFALAGQPLVTVPDGFLLGAWCELRGDWQFLRDALNLKHHYGAHKMCHLCAAEKTPGTALYMGDFQLEGELRQSLVGPLPSRVQPGGWESNEPITPLTKLPGFSVWRCIFDLMHTLELGLLQRVIPAALQGLLGLRVGAGRPQEPSMFEGATIAARCRACTEAYKAWAQRKGVSASSRVRCITKRWVAGAWPTISQQNAKAAALRAMLPWVAELAEERIGESNAATLRANCLRGLADMDKVYWSQPRFLTADQEQAAMGHCVQALRALADLSKLSPMGPWRLIPKAHALLHLACDSAMGNPRVAHCYQDEDFVGRMRRVYVSCHGTTAPLRSLQRYSLGCSVALAAREELLQGKRRPKARRLRGGPLRPRESAVLPAGSAPAEVSASGGGSEQPATKRASPAATTERQGRTQRGRPPRARSPRRGPGNPTWARRQGGHA